MKKQISNQTFNFFNTNSKKREEALEEPKHYDDYKNNTKVYNCSNTQNDVKIKAHKQTYQEKNLIPHPKAKIAGFKNPFISQIKIK